MGSKLEARLYQELTLLSRQERAPWPLPEREIHPMWCCEHRKKAHGALVGGLEAKPWCNECQASHEYHRERNYRCDFVWPSHRVIVEVEGVVYRPKEGQGVGRHQQAHGFEDDLEKYAALQLAGWHVVRLGRRQITSGEALTIIKHALEAARLVLLATPWELAPPGDNHGDNPLTRGGRSGEERRDVAGASIAGD